MNQIHFPYVEAGRVRPVCGAIHTHAEWTTAPDRVTCRRCLALLQSSDVPERFGPRPAAAEPAVSRSG